MEKKQPLRNEAAIPTRAPKPPKPKRWVCPRKVRELLPPAERPTKKQTDPSHKILTQWKANYVEAYARTLSHRAARDAAGVSAREISEERRIDKVFDDVIVGIREAKLERVEWGMLEAAEQVNLERFEFDKKTKEKVVLGLDPARVRAAEFILKGNMRERYGDKIETKNMHLVALTPEAAGAIAALVARTPPLLPG